MRTKTMLLSALLGTLGSVAVMAQSNVYSLNIVGYVNTTLYPGWNLVTCPLLCSPDNSLSTLMNNSTEYFGGPQGHTQVYLYSGGTYATVISAVNPAVTATGWSQGGQPAGTNTILPGNGAFVLNPWATNYTITWVGTVPTGSQTNTLTTGWNMVGSTIPAMGDIITNPIMNMTTYRKWDLIYTYDGPSQAYTFWEYFPAISGWGLNGNTGNKQDPVTTNVTAGFFYYNTTGAGNSGSEVWVENFSI